MRNIVSSDFSVGGANRFALTRRDLVVGGASAAIGAALPTIAAAQATPVRMDIATFAQNADRLAKFEAAVKEMQDRSRRNSRDPKGWRVNADEHRIYCPNSGTDANQVHFCYWFLSWHRAYIHVTERKIREISGDPTLCYPYWNWSSDRGIPQAYARAGSPLANAVRFTPPRALSDGEVGFFRGDPDMERLGVAALGVRIFEAQTPQQISRSLGGIARPNPAQQYANNALESTPHGPVHVYVGGVSPRGAGGDMSDFATAARDPIFFAHHGNLDRLWESWRRDPARKATEPTSDAFLNHEFVFTWLDGGNVSVRAADTLDTTKLGYVYDSLDVFRVGAPVAMAAQQSAGESLPSVGSSTIKAPFAAQGATDGNARTILEITDVQAPDSLMTVGVYLRTPQTPPELSGANVGSFAAVKAGGKISWPSQTLSFDITDAARKFAGQEITVDLIPYRIRSQGAESYPKLKYGGMRIVTEK